jgi:site-specific recombinase XerD
MYPQKHRSGNTTWKVRVGKKNDGNDDLRNFDTEQEATAFMQNWNAKFLSGNTNALSDLSALQRADILAAVERLKPYGATVPEAVDFFIRYAKPERGTITLKEAVDEFLVAKEKLNKSEAYLQGCRKTFFLPFSRAFPKSNLSDLTQREAEKYLDAHPNWSTSTRASHIKYLRTFYNFFVRKGYAKLNPFQNIETPTTGSTKPKVISPEATEKLLQFALDNDHKPECAIMALVFFCGVRVQEAGRLNWEDLDLESATVEISDEKAKTRHRRVNQIPENALEWLKLCKSTSGIRPNDFLQRMKRLRKKAGIEYPQNAMRHCFASYHLAQHKDASKTALMLGHPNPTMLYDTYYQLIKKPENVKTYWNIIPASVRAVREAANDQAEREAAEFESNCGMAEKIDGKWIPVNVPTPISDEEGNGLSGKAQ